MGMGGGIRAANKKLSNSYFNKKIFLSLIVEISDNGCFPFPQKIPIDSNLFLKFYPDFRAFIWTVSTLDVKLLVEFLKTIL